MGLYKVVSCLFNFKQMQNLPATSFLENKRYGLQAREQGFPKLCPTLLGLKTHCEENF